MRLHGLPILVGVLMVVSGPVDSQVNPEIDRAIAVGETKLHETELQAEFCNAVIPEASGYFDAFDFLWRSNNEVELRALESAGQHGIGVLHDVDDRAIKVQLERIKGSPKEDQIKYCGEYAIKIKNGDSDIRIIDPVSSSTLADYLSNNPLPKTELQRLNDRDGCMKKIYNNALSAGSIFNLASSEAVCTCVSVVMQKNVTDEDRAQMQPLLETGQSVADQPAMKKLVPMIAECIERK